MGLRLPPSRVQDALDVLAGTLAGLDDDRRRILGQNAIAAYGLPIREDIA